MQPVSVIVLVEHCDAGDITLLRCCLQDILAQRHPDFEVIVALCPEAAQMAQPLLEHLELACLNLRHVVAPPASRFIQPGQMATTLAVRAARCEWIVMTQGDCRPLSPHWLEAMTAKMTDKVDALAAYANYDSLSERTGLRASYRRAAQNIATIRLAAATHSLYHADAANAAFRRSVFLDTRGFRELTGIANGAIVVWLNSLTRVDAVTSPDACVMQQLPDEFLWSDPDRQVWRTLRPRLANTSRYRRRMMLLTCLPMLLMPLYPIYLVFAARLLNRRVAALGDRPSGLYRAWTMALAHPAAAL